MWSELIQGVFGVGAIGVALKMLIPVMQSSLNASAARAGLDEGAHRMIQDLLKQCRELSDGLAKAQSEVVKVTAELNEARRELASARLAIADEEKRCKLQGTSRGTEYTH